ncbi:hypothetical protein PBI_SCTP2_198 [Salicola phage SCTP-2]|nr:hypothetical protein PBI_SCTP2_198 [Salicola phage SCTP-2]
MNSSIFSSFSKTTFQDLHNINVASYHSDVYYFEIEKGIITNYEKNIDIDKLEVIDRDSYLIGLATDNKNYVHIDLVKNSIVLLDNNEKNKPQRKMKDFLYFHFQDNIIELECKPNAKVYYDDFNSLSWYGVPLFDQCSISDKVQFNLQSIKLKP